ncbi:YjcQ family protein [Clostridioides difficile]
MLLKKGELKRDKIIYSFLKELENNEDRMIKGEKIIIPQAEDYGIAKDVYGKIILKMETEGLISCYYATAKCLPSIIFSAEITSTGKLYLKENSKLGQLYKGLKEIASFIH